MLDQYEPKYKWLHMFSVDTEERTFTFVKEFWI
jgi:hypothetical protein